MKRLLLVIGPLLLAAQGALAATSSGSGALALAALVGAHSPMLPRHEKTVLADLLNGSVAFSFPASKKIEVRADSVVCRSSDVDITMHNCEFTFGKRKVSLNGRAAHEIYATLVEVGVRSEGAAGSIYESVSKLACTIDPHQVAQKGGGGAECSYTPGPG